jgi:ubiquinone/menaquinone biosynthesis C-methylase UbiE
LLTLAALARIGEHVERSSQMASDTIEEAARRVRAVWSLGDYDRFAREMMWETGAVLVDACGIEAGQQVLDVAAGTGNTALRAAERGAHVVASDLTPESLARGEDAARAGGLELEWVEADAQALPFGDGEFDVVTSSFGAMWAPDHQAVADELVRVCRPGGTIGLASFTPGGLIAPFLGVFAPYMPPPPPDAGFPPAWGDEEHVRRLFGDRVSALEATRREYVEESPGGPEAYRDYYKATFGPAVALYAALADDPARTAALDGDFLAFATEANEGTADAARYRYEYLVVVAERR